MQVSSHITDAQQYAINFTNNNLLGSANFIDTYKTSKARICVTVGMMTTGYDCPDILNLGLFRPIFSPTDFIQIKGRGTRKHNFLEHLFDDDLKDAATNPEKIHYKLFDFFANCEYFEEEFNYDEVLTLPRPQGKAEGSDDGSIVSGRIYEHLGEDIISSVMEETIGFEGMKIDRMFFDKFEDKVKDDSVIKEHIEKEQWDSVIDYINEEVMDKPEEFFNLDKLRKAAGVDRRLSLREILEKTFGMIDRFKSKNELLDEEFNKFISDRKPGNHNDIMSMKYFFKAYVTDHSVRNVIESGNYTGFNTNSSFTMQDFKAVPEDWRKAIPEYVKDYVPLNQFMA